MKIYVGNLNQETTEPLLRESFEKYGTVATLDIIKDKENNKPKGFAFVEMSSDDEAKKAIAELHGQNLAGNMIKVSEANQK